MLAPCYWKYRVTTGPTSGQARPPSLLYLIAATALRLLHNWSGAVVGSVAGRGGSSCSRMCRSRVFARERVERSDVTLTSDLGGLKRLQPCDVVVSPT